MTTSGTNKKGVRFIVDVRIMEKMKIFIHMRILSTKSPSLIKYEGIIQYRYENIHVSFDFNALKGTIQTNFLFPYNEGKKKEFEIEDIVHRLDVLVLENPELLGINVMEPYVFNKKFTV
uniref:C1 protein n=1 Tax=Cotton leaf curl Multan betasatellite TaxID=306025 RepID=A0A3G2CIV8_9VIRU|nr:C1 protein [Cotton leaf curl Multan betasatellite]